MKAEKNPFRASEIAKIRYRLETAQHAELVERICTDRWQSSIVGPEGSGKTTLLEDLESSLNQRGYATHWARLKTETTRTEQNSALESLKQLKADVICLFDGAEVLNFWQWQRLIRYSRRNGFGLLLTLHKRAHFPVLIETKTSLETAQGLVAQLSDTPHLAGIAETAFKQHKGNIREVFRACYWACARRL